MQDVRNKYVSLQRPQGKGLVCNDCHGTNAWKFKLEVATDRNARLAKMSKDKTGAARITWQNLVFDWLAQHLDSGSLRLRGSVTSASAYTASQFVAEEEF